MAKAEHRETLNVAKDVLFDVITHYEDYPQFVEGVKAVSVERKGEGAARATYKVDVMKEVNYVLDHKEDRAAGRVEWKLVSSDTFKTNNGRWELKEVAPNKTEALYVLEVEFNIPVPGFILNRLVKGQLPSMVKSFATRAAQPSSKQKK